MRHRLRHTLYWSAVVISLYTLWVLLLLGFAPASPRK